MSFCMYCGNQLPEGANVCPSCGQWVATNQPAQAQVNNYQQAQPNMYQQAPQMNYQQPQQMYQQAPQMNYQQPQQMYQQAPQMPPMPEVPVAPIMPETPVAPIEEIVAPVEEIVAPVEEVVAPIGEIVAPVEEVVAPIEEVVAPVEEIVAPAEEYVAPMPEVTAPVQEPINNGMPAMNAAPTNGPAFIPVPPVAPFMPQEPVMPNPMMGQPMNPIPPMGMPNAFAPAPAPEKAFQWSSVPNRFGKDFKRYWFLTLIILLSTAAEYFLINANYDKLHLYKRFPMKNFITHESMSYFTFFIMISFALTLACELLLSAYAGAAYNMFSMLLLYGGYIITNLFTRNDIVKNYNVLMLYIVIFVICHSAATRKSAGAAITLRFLIPMVGVILLYVSDMYGGYLLEALADEKFELFSHFGREFKYVALDVIFCLGFVLLLNLVMIAYNIKDARHWKEVAEKEN